MDAGPPPCPEASDALESVLARALEPDPAKRATPTLLARKIEAALAGEKAAPSRRGLAVALVAALSLLGVGAVVLSTRAAAVVELRPAPPPTPPRSDPKTAATIPSASVTRRRRSHVEPPREQTAARVKAFFEPMADHTKVGPRDLEALAAVFSESRAADPELVASNTLDQFVKKAYEARWPAATTERKLEDLEIYVNVAIAFRSPTSRRTGSLTSRSPSWRAPRRAPSSRDSWRSSPTTSRRMSSTVSRSSGRRPDYRVRREGPGRVPPGRAVRAALGPRERRLCARARGRLRRPPRRAAGRVRADPEGLRRPRPRPAPLPRPRGSLPPAPRRRRDARDAREGDGRPREEGRSHPCRPGSSRASATV